MRRGFTLVELLIVIVIVGVMAMVIGPTFSSGSDIARVKTAARGLMQMSRYARTMALLHQTPVDLVVSSGGTLSVVPAAGGGESKGLVSASAFAVTNTAEAAAAKEAAAAEVSQSEAGGTGGGAAYVMADLAVDKKYEQVSFVFEEFTDTMEDNRKSRPSRVAEETSEDESGETAQTVKLRYKSNGTCRPCRVRVAAVGTESFAVTVVIDLLGAAKIEEEDE